MKCIRTHVQVLEYNEPVDCRPSRGTNKQTQDRKRCSLLDDNSTATADYDSAHANYTVNYIRQLQNHDYIHMTTTTSYKSILLHVTIVWINQATMKALYTIYIVPDVYYCNKYEIIVYKHIIQCSQCHNYNAFSRTARIEESLTLSTSDDFTIRLITETFPLI